MSERSVLHVLPHGGWGNQTYIDVLAGMPGYRFSQVELTSTRHPLAAAPWLAARLVTVARRARSHDLVHLHGEVASTLSLPLLRRPAVVTLHGLHLLRRVSGYRRRAAERSLRRVVGRAQRTICVSEDEARDAAAVLPPALARRLVVVHNGLPAPDPVSPDQRSAARQALGLDEAAVVAVYAGQLESRKDPLTAAAAVLRARAAAPDLCLLMAGDGPLLGEVRALEQPGLRVLGHRTDVDRLMAAADVFVLPSRREGLSYALLEAMGRGLAPLVADAPGNPEAVGDAGVVARAGDVDAFAEALIRLATDPGERRRLGAAARDRTLREFDAGSMVEGTRATYDAALSGGHAQAPPDRPLERERGEVGDGGGDQAPGAAESPAAAQGGRPNRERLQ